GWSIPLVMKEVFSLYEAKRLGEEYQREQRRPYRDYIEWLGQQDKDEAAKYWKAMLKGFVAPTPLPGDKGQSRSNGDNRLVGERLSLQTSVQLQKLSREHKVTMNTIVQGAWALLLSRYSGEEDVVFGATVSGRPANLAGVEQMLGLFINTLPVRVKIEPEKELVEWLKEVQSRQVQTQQYEYSPLVDVQGWSEVERGIGLFESIL